MLAIVVLVLGILYLCGLSVATPLAICCVVLGGLQILLLICKVIKKNSDNIE